MRSTLLFLAACFLAFGVAAGCTKETEGGGEIAVIVSTMDNPWFVILGNTAKARAEKLGYTAVLFDSQNDTAKEAAHFDNIIAGGYRAILFNPTDADASIASVRRAKEAGLPVFCMDREINATDAATAQILSDNYEGAVTLGEYFAKSLGLQGTYVELLGLAGDNNTFNRSDGFHSVVDGFKGLKRVAHEHGDFDRDVARRKLDTILQNHPDIDAVFCGNDAMAMGAYRSLVAAGKAEQVKVFGFDGAEDVVKAIAAGKIKATGMQFPKDMARTAAEWADEYLRNGKRDFTQKVLVQVELVTRENVATYVPYGRKEDG